MGPKNFHTVKQKNDKIQKYHRKHTTMTLGDREKQIRRAGNNPESPRRKTNTQLSKMERNPTEETNISAAEDRGEVSLGSTNVDDMWAHIKSTEIVNRTNNLGANI